MWKHGFSTTGKQGKAGETMIEESIAAVKQAEQQAESMAADARKQAEELLRQGEETVQKIRAEAEEKAKQAADACMEKARRAGEEALEKAAGEIGAETAELRKQVEKKLPDAAEAVKKLILGD